MSTRKRALFIDRDGTLVKEPPVDYQLDSLEKLEFVPKVMRNLYFIRERLDFEFVMVSNQDGLGTPSFPEETFWPAHNLILKTLEGEGIVFDDILIDPSFPEDNSPNRKPRTGMLTKYMTGEYDLENSFVIGDRLTDMELAHNLGAKGIWLRPEEGAESELAAYATSLSSAYITDDWDKITEYLFAGERRAVVRRATKETDIYVDWNLDGTGKTSISTGLGFFDHMLDQIGKHSGTDLTVRVKGDLEVDEHHTIEDTAIALGEAMLKALGDKRGIERYGYCLPMDDCLCSVALDFGGRPWLVWDAEFHREKVGDMPTEMFLHFFKSLSDAARMNLNIRAEGTNEHHKIEGIFKALARSIKMAIRRDIYRFELPSTKRALVICEKNTTVFVHEYSSGFSLNTIVFIHKHYSVFDSDSMTSDKPIKAYRGYSSKAYRTVERYLSPVSGSNATIVFPSFSGSLASSTAAYTAAPEDIPTSNPSFPASSRLVRIASSFVTCRILSTTSPL